MRRATRLGELGLTTKFVALDFIDAAREHPALLDVLGRCESPEEVEQFAFEWFEEHPQQPTERSKWPGRPEHPLMRGIRRRPPGAKGWRTPDWPGGQLPPFEDDETRLPPQRPPLPNESQLNSYSHGTLEKAVRDWGRGRTRGDVERRAKLPPQDARRVRLMIGVDLLRLNADRKLVVGERVARKGSRYVLRYLDETGSRWLDPNVELRGR